MKTSLQHPGGRPETWPYRDWLAWYFLLQAAEFRLMSADATTTAEAQNALIDAVHEASRDVELDGGQNHWLVDAVLSGSCGLFYDRSRDIYATADELLKNGNRLSFDHLGAEAVAYARRLAGMETGH